MTRSNVPSLERNANRKWTSSLWIYIFTLTLSTLVLLIGCKPEDKDNVEVKEVFNLGYLLTPLFNMIHQELIEELGGEEFVAPYSKENSDGVILWMDDVPYKGCTVSLEFYKRKPDWKPKDFKIVFPMGNPPKNNDEAFIYLQTLCGARMAEFGQHYSLQDRGFEYKRASGDEGSFTIRYSAEIPTQQKALIIIRHTIGYNMP